MSPKKVSRAVATPGASGRWPDEQAARTFSSRLTTIPERARHEAGHGVVANVLGVKCKSIQIDRSVGDIADSAVFPRKRGGWAPTNEPYSHEEQIVIMFGGRVESERQGLFLPFVLQPAGDEGYAIFSALSLAHDDPTEASKILVSSYAEAKRILDAHQNDVAAVAAALLVRDLGASDVECILGAVPAASTERRVRREDAYINIATRTLLQCITAMMAGHPFALARIPGFPSTLLWLDIDGRLRGFE